MIAIEYDGSYWHNKPEIKNNDIRRQKYLESKGWSFIRYTDYIPSEKELKYDIYNIFEG